MFEGNELYYIGSSGAYGEKVKVLGNLEHGTLQVEFTSKYGKCGESLNDLSWNPPKRTFMLNGEELPLPDGAVGDCEYVCRVGDSVWCYKSTTDAYRVLNAFEKLLRGEK